MRNGLIYTKQSPVVYDLLMIPGMREFIEKRAYFNWLNGYSEDADENWNEAISWLYSLRGSE
jgi:hypothetical protein